ncbi:MAG: DUF2911 domain-containing protein [Acidobacteria bacterium]|nr:DUF2911 domain-containing protein [Acidobacteriota bacterium]
MNRSYTTFGAAFAALLLSTTLFAQKTTELKKGSGGSPHARTEWTIDGANISIEYGRPLLKGRPETAMMPAGQVWRTGADEQTTLKTDKPLKFGSITVPPGAYGIHTIPGAGEWTLIISKRSAGWGIPYPAGQDLGRTTMKVGKASGPVEMLTFHIDDTPAGATLRLEWGTTSVSTPFTVG